MFVLIIFNKLVFCTTQVYGASESGILGQHCSTNEYKAENTYIPQHKKKLILEHIRTTIDFYL